MVKRAEINQRIKLRKQIADGDSDRLAVVRELHHQVYKALVLDLALNQPAQGAAVDAVEEFADV